MKSRRVSIIMPIFTSPGFSINLFKDTIDGIISQTYKNIEFIPVIDGGGDIGKLHDVFNIFDKNKIRSFLLDRNYGAQAAMNFGFYLSNGDCVAFQDQDDISRPDRIEKLIHFVDEEKGMAGSFVGIKKGGKFRTKGFYINRVIELFEKGIISVPTHFGSLLMSRDFFNDTGGFENILVADSLFCIKSNIIFHYGYRKNLHLVEEPLFTWIRHRGGNSYNKRDIVNNLAKSSRKKIADFAPDIVKNYGKIHKVKELLGIKNNINIASKSVSYKIREPK